jgi:hypothetical protein
MTLADAERLAGSDPEHLAKVARCRKALGEGVRSALAAGDGAALERACRLAGTHRALMAAAVAAGVDRDDLKDALGNI